MKRLLLSLLALLPLAGHAGELRGVRLATLDGGTRIILDLSTPTTAKVFSLRTPVSNNSHVARMARVHP